MSLNTIPEDVFTLVAWYTWNKKWKRKEIKDLATRIADIQDSIPDAFKNYWYTDKYITSTWRFTNPLISGQPFYPVDLTLNHWNRRHAYSFLNCIQKSYFHPKLKRPLYRHFKKPLYREWNTFYKKIRDVRQRDFHLPICMIQYHVPDFYANLVDQSEKRVVAEAANLRWCLRFLETLRYASVTLKPF